MHVSRASWTEPYELLALIDGAAEVGFDTVVFEDRRYGTVVHPSAYEPWSEALNGVDPGWDPLAVALERAHERGLRFLVAMQVIPVWYGASPPRDARHPWQALSAWRWRDASGEEQALRADALVSLDPCLPEVRRYLANVVVEPLRRYPIDGLLLVDARFPNEYPALPRGNPGDAPRSARALELYRAATGLAPDDDAAAWLRWRANQLTALVALIRSEARAALGPDRSFELDAEVCPEREVAETQQQDWRAWLREGLVDAVVPFDDGLRAPVVWRERQAEWRDRAAGGARVMPVLTVEPDPFGVALTGEWGARLAGARAATGAVLVAGAEPWLASGLADLASGNGSRSALARALAASR
ncbi:MAG: family 10 glycosylhydrolase [Planctomycetota bacterium]